MVVAASVEQRRVACRCYEGDEEASGGNGTRREYGNEPGDCLGPCPGAEGTETKGETRGKKEQEERSRRDYPLATSPTFASLLWPTQECARSDDSLLEFSPRDPATPRDRTDSHPVAVTAGEGSQIGMYGATSGYSVSR